MVPGSFKRRYINPFRQADKHLLDIYAGLRRIEAVKQHSLLHWRDRIAGFNLILHESIPFPQLLMI
jgi:hypothetical protein